MKKNITLSVDEAVIAAARKRAAVEDTTIHDLLRAWLKQYAEQSPAEQYEASMDRLAHVNAGRKFTR